MKLTDILSINFLTTNYFKKIFSQKNDRTTPNASTMTKNIQDSLIDYLPNHYIFWKDKNSVFLGCNKAFALEANLSSPAEIIGKTDYDLPWSKEESDAYQADDRQVIESKKAKLNIEEIQTLPNNKKRILLTSKFPLFDEKGEVNGILAVYSDFTEKKLAEKKLLEIHQKLEAAYQHEADLEKQLQESIINHLPNHFIFWKDTNSIYLGCNKAFATSLGFNSPNGVTGKTDYDFPVKKEDSDAYRADDEEVMASKVPKLNVEEPQTLANGETRILLTSKVPLIDAEDHVYGVLAIYSDITKQKLNELELIETNKKLEKSYQVKSEFIRNISHDIRTPLSGIQQTVQAIAEGKIPEKEIPEYSLAAWEASKKLMELFNQIIDSSQNENFDFQDQIVKFDLYKLLQDLDETYKIVAKHKNIKLEIEYSENAVPHYLLGKHLRLHRILMNILGNALKFTEKGGVKLVVEKADESEEKIIMRFSIIDTGIGIPKEKYDVIFEPFTRLTPSFQGYYHGSGLGLHVVKDYVEKMQGEIYVESEEGNGSMFTCVLPFKRPILNNDNDIIETEYKQDISGHAVVSFSNHHSQNKRSTQLSNSAVGQTENYRVLLVEDDALAQNMGKLILINAGNKVDLAKSGEEAIQLTEKNHYDIIYMDVGLPGIDGIEATKCIRSNKENHSQNAFISALTAHADDEISKQCYDAGMQQVLFKPLSIENAQQINRHLTQTDPSKTNKKIIDYNLWRNRLGNNVAMLDELFHMVAKDFNNNKLDIIQAYEAHDLHKLKAITHKMKGGLKYCGLPRLETAIIVIESAAKNNNKKEVDKSYQETLDAIDETKKAYEEWARVHPI